jgi:hypothetical protein
MLSSLREGDAAETHTCAAAVGSQTTWRTAMSLPAGMQNSRQNGGRVFPIFVADPRTVRRCRNRRLPHAGVTVHHNDRPAGTGVEIPALHLRSVAPVGGTGRQVCAVCRWQGVPIGVSGGGMDRPDGNDGGMTQTDALSRPDPVRWLWYTFGGDLDPRRYREWVLDDITSRTRWVRQVARTVVQVAPVGAMVILVLGFGWITWVSLIGGLMLAMVYSGAFFDQFAEHRLLQSRRKAACSAASRRSLSIPTTDNRRGCHAEH